MITATNTVLVLGAGASKPYGFPSAFELLQEVSKKLKHSGSYVQSALAELGFQTSDMEIFRKELLRSARYSVDAFLEQRPEYIDIGKAAIATILLSYEAKSEIQLFDPLNYDWYQYLFNRLNAPFSEFGKNVGFITFNYDRSLEYFLFVALKANSGKTRIDCSAKLKEIPIIHIYGQLGYLHWQKGYQVSYGHTGSAQEIKLAANEIRIVHEDKEEDLAKIPRISEARSLLRNATRVFFFGFGYHKANIERLDLESCPASCKGTCSGLMEDEVARVEALFHSCKKVITLAPRDYKILDYLRRIGI